MKRWMLVALGALMVFVVAGAVVWTAVVIEDGREAKRQRAVCVEMFPDREDAIDRCVLELQK